MRVYTIFPQINECNETWLNGRVIEAWYIVAGNMVTLTDAEGVPLRDSWGEIVKGQMTPGQIISPRVVASRLALRRWRATRDEFSDFHRPLGPQNYPRTPC
jgi:hypothetical protein